MEECMRACVSNERCRVSCKTYFRGFCMVIGLFVFLVWFWQNISPCQPPLGVCGRAAKNGIRTLDLLDEAQILTKSTFLTIVCGIIEAELNCLETFFQQCLSSNEKDNKFYSSLHLEAISAMHQFCEPATESEPGSLSTCWSAIRERRNECISEFSQSPGGHMSVIMDSLFDDLDTGVYRKELCWAVRDAVICSLSVARLVCGEEAAKSWYHLMDNITKLIYTEKCDENIRPEWEDSSLRIMRQSFRPFLLQILRILQVLLLIFLIYGFWKTMIYFKRWVLMK